MSGIWTKLKYEIADSARQSALLDDPNDQMTALACAVDAAINTELTDPDRWSKAYDKRPQNPLCSREIDITIVGERCVYVDATRVAGGKPYVSENLPSLSKATTVRDVLSAFTEEELLAYLAERREVNAYCAGLRAFRDADREPVT